MTANGTEFELLVKSECESDWRDVQAQPGRAEQQQPGGRSSGTRDASRILTRSAAHLDAFITAHNFATHRRNGPESLL
jgi:hypothetical protein